MRDNCTPELRSGSRQVPERSSDVQSGSFGVKTGRPVVFCRPEITFPQLPPLSIVILNEVKELQKPDDIGCLRKTPPTFHRAFRRGLACVGLSLRSR